MARGWSNLTKLRLSTPKYKAKLEYGRQYRQKNKEKLYAQHLEDKRLTYHARKAAGVCVQCGKRDATPLSVYCDKCWERTLVYRRRYEMKKKREKKEAEKLERKRQRELQTQANGKDNPL